jgi:hypothetical protein
MVFTHGLSDLIAPRIRRQRRKFFVARPVAGAYGNVTVSLPTILRKFIRLSSIKPGMT